MPSRPTIRRELLFSFAVLFTGAVVVSSVALFLVLPVLQTPGQAALFIALLLAGDLAILFFFGRSLLGRHLLEPLDRLVADVSAIAEGHYEHEIAEAETRELHALSRNVEAMARRLIRDQKLLTRNIRSLDETNRELIIARQQMVRAARLATVGTLAAGIAHEIGNPLGAIMAYLDVARKRVEGEEELEELVTATSREARRIDRIIRSLLDYARPRSELKEEADPVAVTDRVRSLLEAQGRLDDVEVVWEAPERVSAVQGDPQHLEQILVNLLLNAGEALEGRDDGRILVTVDERPGEGLDLPRRREDDPPGIDYAHRRRISRSTPTGLADPVRTAERVVELTVADNGPGLSDEVLEQIFDPFFTTKEPGKGTGLGMAVCARLVHEMGGRIEAGNRDEGGAVFTLTFPAGESTARHGGGDA